MEKRMEALFAVIALVSALFLMLAMFSLLLAGKVVALAMMPTVPLLR